MKSKKKKKRSNARLVFIHIFVEYELSINKTGQEALKRTSVTVNYIFCFLKNMFFFKLKINKL